MLSVVILLVLCAAYTTSVILTGEYVKLQWYFQGPKEMSFLVGGVTIYKPNDVTIMNATNSFSKKNIQCLMMDFNNMKYLPANYTRFFPSISFLIVRYSRVKYVTKDDFLGFNNLHHVDLRNNEIEYIPENLFQGILQTIKTLFLINNKIINVGPKFIDAMPKLQYLLMMRNPCINLDYPVFFSLFVSTFKNNCQQKIMPDVMTGPPPTYEEHNALKIKSVDVIKTNDNLTAELKLKNDRIKELERINQSTNNTLVYKNKLKSDLKTCKSSKNSLQNELITTENKLQTMKLRKTINKRT